mmetsp:Transcript_25033/g.44601  ORF Transcript_25033/g.44601 Transcript_25033/m.44601 type:complete len:338 (-) Transcript_25033:2006-3019(-)
MDERDAHRQPLQHRPDGGRVQLFQHFHDVVRVVAVLGPRAGAPHEHAHRDAADDEAAEDELAAHVWAPSLGARKLLVLLQQLLATLAQVAHVAEPPTTVDEHEGDGDVGQPGGGRKEVRHVLIVLGVVREGEIDGEHRVGAKGERKLDHLEGAHAAGAAAERHTKATREQAHPAAFLLRFLLLVELRLSFDADQFDHKPSDGAKDERDEGDYGHEHRRLRGRLPAGVLDRHTRPNLPICGAEQWVTLPAAPPLRQVEEGARRLLLHGQGGGAGGGRRRGRRWWRRFLTSYRTTKHVDLFTSGGNCLLRLVREQYRVGWRVAGKEDGRVGEWELCKIQ